MSSLRSSYNWWLFVHLAGVFGFLLAHGVSTAVTFRLRKERDRARVAALLELSGSSLWAFYASLLVLLAAGVILGFQIDAWSQGWIWTSLAILIGTGLLMGAVAGPYYRRLRRGIANERSMGDAELDARLRSGRPVAIAVLGFAAITVILWLMIFKPF